MSDDRVSLEYKIAVWMAHEASAVTRHWAKNVKRVSRQQKQTYVKSPAAANIIQKGHVPRLNMQLNARHPIKGGDVNVTRDQSRCNSILIWMLPDAPHVLFRSNVANCYVRKGIFRGQGSSASILFLDLK